MPPDNEDYVLLTNIYENEIQLVETILEENDIPYYKKSPGSGEIMDVYMGMNRLGVNFYIPSSYLAEARKILKSEGITLASKHEKDKSNISSFTMFIIIILIIYIFFEALVAPFYWEQSLIENFVIFLQDILY